MGWATVCGIGLVGTPLLMYLLMCGYVWATGTAQFGVGQGVYLHAKAVPFVALIMLTRVRRLPLVLAADVTGGSAWISPPFASTSTMAASQHLYDLPAWTWYARGFRV